MVLFRVDACVWCAAVQQRPCDRGCLATAGGTAWPLHCSGASVVRDVVSDEGLLWRIPVLLDAWCGSSAVGWVLRVRVCLSSSWVLSVGRV